MDRLWIGAVVAAVIIAVAAWLMVRSWRRRTRRDEAMSAYAVPASHGEPRLAAEALYVATTPASEPLERLAVHGPAFRGSARIEGLPEGVVLRIAGETPTLLPADRIEGAGVASFALDRAVEPEGLVAITWIANTDDPDAAAAGPRVDSYLRARYPGDSARIIAAVEDIAAAPVAPRQKHESEASDD
ncbi:hypothetical protein [Agromyces sp. Marseille-P2726]|uniref:PH-like domain-containing protein n=1 Tax=Agromyces sp. Marseille-P2726 TaxID=2709132 RepID=UPI00156F970F|nr:hypothetical protein [Agromyces sp. Marseille-P2726]